MSKSIQRTPIPALIGRSVIYAYSFSDELDGHGIVLTLDDGSDVSIEFNFEPRLALCILQCGRENDDAVVLQNGR